MIHGLQTCLEHSLQGDAKNIVDVCATVVREVRSHEVLRRELEQLQVNDGIQNQHVKMLSPPCTTRWDADQDMMRRMAELDIYLRELVSRLQRGQQDSADRLCSQCVPCLPGTQITF